MSTRRIVFIVGLMALHGMTLAANAQAAELRELYRGTRAAGMGGAFIAIADDEEAIFMNPAGLAGIKGFTFNYVAADVELSTDAIAGGQSALSLLSNMGSISGSTLNTFMGQNIFAHAQIAPSLVMPKFGVSFISDHQAALSEKNIANPNIVLGYQSTNGIQVAFGTSVLGRKATRGDLRVGIAGKMMWRKGGYHTLGFADMLALSQDATTYLGTITGGYGVGYGVDVGSQYLFNLNKRITFSSGLVMTDIGNTSFSDSHADPIKSNLSWGLGASFKLTKVKVNFAYDFRHLLDDTEFRARNHVGLELVLPFISISGGLYQMALTYGASFDLWVFRISAASYAEEQGTYVTQDSERRYDLRVALKFGF